MANLVKDYLNELDWRVRENSNASFSYQGLNQHVATSVVSKYWLEDVYSKDVANAHRSGAMHIHDLGMLTAYCCGWDLYDLLSRGFGGVYGKVQASPPKHFSSALGQLVNFMYTMAGELAGAVAVSNFDTLLAPFVRYDKLEYSQVKQFIQEFVYNMNAPTRLGFQSVFSNLTMDLTPSPNYVNECVVIGGELQNQTYGEFQVEMDLINKAFCEVMLEGDSKGRVFTFPIPTYNLHKEFQWENQELLWKMTGKYGVPYFANFINSDLRPEDTRSMCCRLRLDRKQLTKRSGGLFAASALTGCYDDKTEILTDRGWVYFSELTKRDNVYTLSSDKEICIQKVNDVFVYEVEDYDMYHISGKVLDMLITPNHKFVLDFGNGIKLDEVRNIDFSTEKYIPKVAKWNGLQKNTFELPEINFVKYGRQGRTPYNVKREKVNIDMKIWLSFLGLFISEGSTDNEDIAKDHGYRVFISQKKKENLEKIESVLNLMPFNYAKIDCAYVICNKQLWNYLRYSVGKDCYTKKIPKEFLFLDSCLLSTLYEYLMLGDGSVNIVNGQETYYTVSKELADNVQEIIIKCGFWANVRKRIGNRISSIKGRKITSCGHCYEISKQKTKRYCVNDTNVKIEKYTGMVYCCEVEKHHTLLVRRNGKAVWSGNSVGVVTINVPRIAYKAQSIEEFYTMLSEVMELAKESLEVKRVLIEDLTEKGLYPYSTHYLDGVYAAHKKYWYNHFSTIGLVGMNEACLNLLKVGIDTEEGKRFSESVLEFMLVKISEYQNETGNLYNLEASPCESATYRMAKSDRKLYPDIITAGTRETPFYSNSTQLPVDTGLDIIDVLEHQNSLQKMYTGGTVVHLLLGESVNSWETVRDFVRMVATQYEIPYFTMTPTFSVCKNHGYINGEVYECPQCNEETEVYSRVVGYLRPTKNWNDAKQLEFKERTTYKI